MKLLPYACAAARSAELSVREVAPCKTRWPFMPSRVRLAAKRAPILDKTERVAALRLALDEAPGSSPGRTRMCTAITTGRG